MIAFVCIAAWFIIGAILAIKWRPYITHQTMVITLFSGPLASIVLFLIEVWNFSKAYGMPRMGLTKGMGATVLVTRSGDKLEAFGPFYNLAPVPDPTFLSGQSAFCVVPLQSVVRDATNF